MLLGKYTVCSLPFICSKISSAEKNMLSSLNVLYVLCRTVTYSNRLLDVPCNCVLSPLDYFCSDVIMGQ